MCHKPMLRRTGDREEAGARSLGDPNDGGR